MPTKSLTVRGGECSGKKTLIGSLVHKCGLQLPQIEELEREGVRNFADITVFYQKNDKPLSFHAPSGLVTIEDSHASDIVFWMVDAKASASFYQSAQQLTTSLNSGSLQPLNQLVILINKMDRVDWSEVVFKDAVNAFSAVKTNIRTYIIPISSLKNHNLITTPQESSWIKGISDNDNEGPIKVSSQALVYLLG